MIRAIGYYCVVFAVATACLAFGLFIADLAQHYLVIDRIFMQL